MNIKHERNASLIRKRFYAYLIPGIIMAVALQFGSLADGIIIGNFAGEVALSASSLALPVVYISQVPAALFAVGASIVVANLLGKRKIEDASRAFKVAMLLGIGISLIFVVIGLTLSGPIAQFLGGSLGDRIPGLVDHIADYSKAFLVQAPVVAASLIFAYTLSSDNSPNLSALFFIVANVVHVGLEILFCLFVKEGVLFWAGLSMGMGFLCGFVVLIPYIRSKNRLLKFERGFAGVSPSLRSICGTGLTQGGTFVLLAVYSLFLNIAATNFLTGASTLAVFAMMQNFIFVVDLIVTGVLQTVPNIVSITFGEKDYFSVKAIAKRALFLTVVASALLMAVSIIYPDMFFYMFGVNLEMAMASVDARLIVRIYCISFLVYGVNKFVAAYYPAILVNLPGIVSQVVRNGVVGIPVLYFSMKVSGAFGYSYGTIITEVSALVVTVIFILIMKKAKVYKGKGIFLLPVVDQKEFVEFSFPHNANEVGNISAELENYAKGMGLGDIPSANVGLAGEEIANNVIAYASRKGKHNDKCYIDVALSKVDDTVLLRIRDDGIAYDPTAEAENAEEGTFSGIEVLRKVATRISYSRVLNTNNTVIELAC